MIQSKVAFCSAFCPSPPFATTHDLFAQQRITKEQRKQIRRLSFATVKEAEEFRKLIAKRSYRTPDGILSCFGYDPFRVQNHSFPMGAMRQSPPRYRMPWAEQQAHDNYMQEMQMQMQRASSFGINKRPFDSDLEFRPPKQRQRMGLSHEQFSPMGASSARMQSLLAQSWQQVARSARPMSRLFPTTMDPAATHSSNHVSAAPSTVACSRRSSTCDSPHSTGDSAMV